MGKISTYPEAPSAASDDYLLLDGSTNGTRKIKPGSFIDPTGTQSGMAADAKLTKDEIEELDKHAMFVDKVLDVNPDSADWETGRLNASSGTPGSSAGAVVYNNQEITVYFCRTKTYVPDNVLAVFGKGTYFPVIFAYENDTYVGLYKNGAFEKTAIVLKQQTYYLNEIREAYPTYQLRIIVCDVSTSTQPTVDNVVANLGYIYKAVTKKYLESELAVTVRAQNRWVNGLLSSTGQDGSTGNSTYIRTVGYIESKTGELKFTVPNGYIARYYLFDASKTFVSSSANIRNTVATVQVPKGYFIRVLVWHASISDISPYEGNLIKIEYNESNVKALSDFRYAETDYAEIGMFPKIGVIGDSFASGTLYDSLTAEYSTTNYAISWPQIIARQEGVDVINFTEGGIYTRTWLGDTDHGLPALLSAEPQNLYVIALGINDAKAITDNVMSLGSIADVDVSDYTQNPDTFYGNYGRIIGNILNHAPKAKVICLSVAREGQRHMDAYIKEIASVYKIPFIDLTEDMYFTSELFYGSIVNDHPLAYGYSGMAKAISNLMRRCIVDNLYYFSDYDGLTSA